MMKANDQIENLVEELRSKDGAVRERARTNLVSIGKQTVPYLVGLLSDGKQQVRWEACKALGSIMDPAAATPLTMALSDESDGVRWAAAEALIALQKHALEPLLQILETKFESPYVRERAHHILHALESQDLLNEEAAAVLEALRYTQPKISVAVAAHKALHTARKSAHKPAGHKMKDEKKGR